MSNYSSDERLKILLNRLCICGYLCSFVFIIINLIDNRRIDTMSFFSAVFALLTLASKVIADAYKCHSAMITVIMVLYNNILLPMLLFIETAYIFTIPWLIIGLICIFVCESRIKTVILFTTAVAEDLLVLLCFKKDGFTLTDVVSVFLAAGTGSLLVYTIKRLYSSSLNHANTANKYLTDNNIELRNLTYRDQLTGLMNRRYYENALQNMITLCNDSSRALSLIILDIDHFKNINDTYGHDIGDVVLKKLAETVKNAVREDDAVCRIGGEEFIILIQADIDTAAMRAEDIRYCVEKLNVEEACKFTVSLGVAQYKKGMTCDELFKDADNMLYLAKESGRNQARVKR